MWTVRQGGQFGDGASTFPFMKVEGYAHNQREWDVHIRKSFYQDVRKHLVLFVQE